MGKVGKGSKGLQIAPGLKIAPNGSKWLNIAVKGSKWLETTPNDSKWILMAPNGNGSKLV